MKLTCVTAVYNAIKSGNRENLIRCVRSVAALKTEHEHLIYDGGSTDGTVELLRELEEKYGKCLNVGIGECLNEREGEIGGENRCTKDGLSFPVDAFVSNASDGNGRFSADAIGTIASTGGESGARGARALPGNESSAIHHSSFIILRPFGS